MCCKFLLLNLPFLAVGLIAVIGVGIMLGKKNMVKVLMGLTLFEAAVNLFLVAIGYRQDGIAPIFTNAYKDQMVMPTVQAMTLTSIVIGVATLAMMLSFVMILYKKYGTADARKIRKLQG